MGVEYSARIVVGLPHEELEEFLQDMEDPYDLGLYIVSPYYDADYCDCLFGVLVQSCNDYSYVQLNTNKLMLDTDEAQRKFKEITGKEGRLYLSTYGS